MKCLEIKKLIPEYVEKDLQPKQNQIVAQHLMDCGVCQHEVETFRKAWAVLTQLPTLEPNPNYISRFWTELSLCNQPWHEKVLEAISGYLPQRRFAPALATACLVLIMGLFAVKNYLYVQESEQILANLSKDDLEMVEFMDLAENYDIIGDIDFFQDLEVIENLDTLES